MNNNVSAILEGLNSSRMINEGKNIFEFDKSLTRSAVKEAIRSLGEYIKPGEDMYSELYEMVKIIASEMYVPSLAIEFEYADSESDWLYWRKSERSLWPAFCLEQLEYDETFEEFEYAITSDFAEVWDDVKWWFCDKYDWEIRKRGELPPMSKKDFEPFKKHIENIRKIVVNKCKAMDNKDFDDLLEWAGLVPNKNGELECFWN